MHCSGLVSKGEECAQQCHCQWQAKAHSTLSSVLRQKKSFKEEWRKHKEKKILPSRFAVFLRPRGEGSSRLSPNGSRKEAGLTMGYDGESYCHCFFVVRLKARQGCLPMEIGSKLVLQWDMVERVFVIATMLLLLRERTKAYQNCFPLEFGRMSGSRS